MTNEPPLVSVLIATFNRSDTLRFALESVSWQTLQDFEVWVIGDACTDNSEDVVKSFNDPRFHWYNLAQNSGYQSIPHNEGLRKARGKYIAYLNQDDIWLPDHLEVLVHAVEREHADFAYSILDWVQPESPSFPDIPIFPHAFHPPEASATLHRSSIIQELGYWKTPQEIRAIPRVEYFRRAQFIGKKFVLVPALTILKFDTRGSYTAVTRQADYMALIRSDPRFAEKELSTLLVRATTELDLPPGWKRIKIQWKNWLRRTLIRYKVEPTNLAFWKPKGHHLRRWRKKRMLD